MSKDPDPVPEKKKKEKLPQRPFLGRFEKNRCRIGIVGLPNVGKSSLFNTLSKKQVPAENYAFCTIEPAQTIVPVHDKRFKHLCEVYQPKSIVEAVLEVWDIAGLVRGAHEGKGLGNEFLSNISSVDAIYHVVRAFKAKDVEHVDGSVDPIRDLETISYELRAKDIASMEKKCDSVSKLAARSTDRRLKQEAECADKVLAVLKEGKDVYYCDWTNNEMDFIRTFALFTAKPVVFLVNVSSSNWEKGANKWIQPIKEWVDGHYPGAAVIPFSAKFEAKLQEMSDEAREKYLKTTKTKSMINKIISAGYKCLGLIHFFTAGADEVKAWTIRDGTKAPQAAGTIHSDMENGFICCETFTYKDWKKCDANESEVKKQGKYLQNGRNYQVKDGDILYFKFNKPSAGKKKKG